MKSNMKKRLIIPAAFVITVLCCSSCDTKLCYCYENGMEQVVYVDSDTPCNSMTRGERGCVESYERMDPSQTAKK